MFFFARAGFNFFLLGFHFQTVLKSIKLSETAKNGDCIGFLEFDGNLRRSNDNRSKSSQLEINFIAIRCDCMGKGSGYASISCHKSRKAITLTLNLRKVLMPTPFQ